MIRWRRNSLFEAFAQNSVAPATKVTKHCLPRYLSYRLLKRGGGIWSYLTEITLKTFVLLSFVNCAPSHFMFE